MLNSTKQLIQTILISLAVILSVRYFLSASSSTLAVKSFASSSALTKSATFATKQASPVKMSAKSQIEDAIKANGVTVFSKSYCPYCKKAKNLLTSLNANAKVFELDEMDAGAEWQAYLADKTGQRTVPMIFIHEKFIGGSSDLDAKNNSGELAKLLKA